MSNGDEILNALAHGSLAEFGNAVLCHHQVRQVPRNGDNGPRVQRGDDAGESALFGGGALGEDGPAAFGMVGAPGEVCGSPGAGVLLGADGLGTDLAGQIDLEGGIDGHHVVILGDDVRIVGVAAAAEAEAGMVVHEVVEEGISREEGPDSNAFVDGFIPVGYGATIDKMGHRSPDLFRVDTQIMLVHKVETDGIGDAAEAKLDTVAVLHELGDVACDGFFRGTDGRVLELIDGFIYLVEDVCHGDRQGALPPDGRGLGVDLKDDLISPVEIFQGHDQITAQVHIPMLVHGGDLSDEDVGRQTAPQFLAVIVLVDGEVGVKFSALGSHGPLVEKEGVVSEFSGQGCVSSHGIVIATDGVPAVYTLGQAEGDGVQLAEKGFRLAAVGGPGETVAVFDKVQRILQRSQPLGVKFPGRNTRKFSG